MNPIVEALSLLTPYDIDRQKVRIGPETDGGYVFADNISPSQTIISYGISTEYRFDAEMAERGHHVYMFDHTIEGVNITNSMMHFQREGVAGVTDEANNLYSIKDHLDKYSISDCDMILKMDVEGAEWDALIAIPDETLARFNQIVIEIHGCNMLTDPAFREKFVETFRKINRQFTLFHVHANNCDGPDGIGIMHGIPVSSLLELSYVRTSTVQRRSSRTLYPTTLDFPNVGAKEKLLWFFPFLPTTASTADFGICHDRVELLEAVRVKGAR